jgi:hypothetical protein
MWIGLHFAAIEAAEKGRIWGLIPEEHTSGAEARIDSIAFVPGIDPRPTTPWSFSAACKAAFVFAAKCAG